MSFKRGGRCSISQKVCHSNCSCFPAKKVYNLFFWSSRSVGSSSVFFFGRLRVLRSSPAGPCGRLGCLPRPNQMKAMSVCVCVRHASFEANLRCDTPALSLLSQSAQSAILCRRIAQPSFVSDVSRGTANATNETQAAKQLHSLTCRHFSLEPHKNLRQWHGVPKHAQHTVIAASPFAAFHSRAAHSTPPAHLSRRSPLNHTAHRLKLCWSQQKQLAERA